MAYDRYDSRDLPREGRSRWRDDRGFEERSPGEARGSRSDERSRGGGDGRGFFERAGDEIASWFGDDNSERREHQDERRPTGERQTGSWRSRDDHSDRGDWDPRGNSGIRRPREEWDDGRSAFSQRYSDDLPQRGRRENEQRQGGRSRDENWKDNRGVFASGGSSERDYDRDWQQEFSDRDSSRRQANREVDRGWTDRYQPITGNYGQSGMSNPRDHGDEESRRQSKWAEDEYRGSSRAGTANWSDRSREDRFPRSRDDRFDPHYRSWRDRHLDELDRDYDDFRAEHGSRFESDFGSWRERRQQKRALLGRVHEKMEVVGSDGKPLGTVDRTAGDRLILARSDAESGGAHHSISCSDVDRIDGERVVLDCTADQARERWLDEHRGRALFEREGEGEAGPRALDRSFGGTYR